jgi:hypothetical protein
MMDKAGGYGVGRLGRSKISKGKNKFGENQKGFHPHTLPIKTPSQKMLEPKKSQKPKLLSE